MLITFEPHGIFCSNFVYLCLLEWSSNWYEKGDEASPSIILAGRALMAKMLITLEPRFAFGSNFEYFFFIFSFLFFFFQICFLKLQYLQA